MTKLPDAVLLNMADWAVFVCAEAVSAATRNARAATPATIAEILFILSPIFM
jgi:hypothetical protein